jgi:decaprenyl-phosphate phosphoribosyltransferase
MRSTGILEKTRLRSQIMPSLGGAWAHEQLQPGPVPASALGDCGAAAEVGAQIPHAVSTAPRRGRLEAAIVTMRPRQWVKNILVIAAAGAAGALAKDDVPARVALAFVAFCLLASGIYAINDVRDRHEDRLHPRKRYRPVAARELEPLTAAVIGCALMAVGLALCAALRPLLLVVGAGYLALTLSYAWIWRQIVLLDVLAIAGGFVLRAIAGGVAAPVTLSRWFMLVITFAAILVAAGKRLAELRRTEARGSAWATRRRVLKLYTPARLRLLMLVSAFGALLAYCVWAFQLPDVDGVPWRPLTIIPFAACLLRYGALVREGRGEAPEDLLLADRLLLAAGAAWLVLFALGVHAAG